MSTMQQRRRPDSFASDSPPQDLGALLKALPPSAIEAEVSLLGSLMRDANVVGDVLLVVDKEDFYKPSHSEIFGVMRELYDQYAALDIVQLNQRLVDLGRLEAVGGPFRQ